MAKPKPRPERQRITLPNVEVSINHLLCSGQYAQRGTKAALLPNLSQSNVATY